MRVEPYAVGSYLHVVKRGARGMPIVGDDDDRRRFLRVLYFMNEEYYDENWETYLEGKDFGYRPDTWPERKPLVHVLGYTLMPNHFHLLIKEVVESGMSTFMQKLGQSMTMHFNAKHQQHGSIFQGSYRSRTVNDDTYFQYVVAYVLVKNTFELYPHDGLKGAIRNFESAWKWALGYPFSNLGSFITGAKDPISDRTALEELLETPQNFKDFARDVIESGKWTQAEFE